MADIRTSFYYDPIRQGYDLNSWKTISGAPAINNNGRIVVDAGTGIPGIAVHYADFLKGDVSFNVNVPTAPTAADFRMFGMSSPSETSYIKFQIKDEILSCETSDGTNTNSSGAILWDSNWTGVNTIYRIRWEAGTAKFFINNTQVYAITGMSVPCGPSSLYLYDNSDSAMTIGDIYVRGTQCFVMNQKTSDTTVINPTGSLNISSSITISENIVMLIPTVMLPFISGEMYESLSISESSTIKIVTLVPSNSETITISENITLTIA